MNEYESDYCKRMKEAQYPCYLVFYGPSKHYISSYNRSEYNEEVEFTEADDLYDGIEKYKTFCADYQGHATDITIKCYPKLQEIEL